MNNKKSISFATATSILVGIGLIVTIPSFASITPTNHPPIQSNHIINTNQKMKPLIIGTVSAINGNNITILGKQEIGFGFGEKRGSATTSSVITNTFSVDAANAKIIKNNATSSISNIIVGDTIIVRGTINGKNITATIIRDGLTAFNRKIEDKVIFSSSTPEIQGNGEPIIAGTISTINSSTLTITNKSNIVYTVDITKAKILQGQKTISISNISLNDNVIIQGTINGTSIIASSVIDQTKKVNISEQKTKTNFLNGIGNFFKHLFGF